MISHSTRQKRRRQARTGLTAFLGKVHAHQEPRDPQQLDWSWWVAELQAVSQWGTRINNSTAGWNSYAECVLWLAQRRNHRLTTFWERIH